MPTYEYICEACGHEFEKFHSMSADPIKVCPVCKKRKVQRKISVGAGFIFKGGGFYETDYRNDAYKKAAEADKAAAEGKPAADAKPTDAISTAPKPAESTAADAKPSTTKEVAPAASSPKPQEPSKSASKSAAAGPTKKSTRKK